MASSFVSQNNRNDFKVIAKCVIEQDTGLVVDGAGTKLPARAVIMCKMTPFVITEAGDIDYLAGRRWKVSTRQRTSILSFFENQIRELHVESSQGIFASIFRGSHW